MLSSVPKVANDGLFSPQSAALASFASNAHAWYRNARLTWTAHAAVGTHQPQSFRTKKTSVRSGNRAFLAGWPRIGRIVRDEASLPRMLYKKINSCCLVRGWDMELVSGCYHVPCFHPGCRMGAQKNSVQYRATPGRNACRSLRGVVFAVSTGGISQTNMWRFPKSWGYPKSSQSLDNFSLA